MNWKTFCRLAGKFDYEKRTMTEPADTIPVHIKRRDYQSAKAYVEGYNSGLETAAYVLECGSFLSNESPEYKWAHRVASLIRARKTLDPAALPPIASEQPK
jgi:Tfp pilus assembly protein PilF